MSDINNNFLYKKIEMKYLLIVLMFLPMGLFAQSEESKPVMMKPAVKPANGKIKKVQKEKDEPCRLPKTKSKIDWFTGDFEAAVKKATKENKKIYAFFTCDG